MPEKKENTGIPVVIGVTGHRNLHPADLTEISGAVRQELHALRIAYPSSPMLLLCSLAEGADQLCAEIALEEGYRLAVPLPMPLPEYEQDFEGKALQKLHNLAARAEEVFVVPQTEPFREGRDYLFRQADLYVAEHCHLLLALWDGKEGRPDGCGTAETVEMKLRQTYCRQKGIVPRPGCSAVCHIPVRRASGNGISGTDSLGADVSEEDANRKSVVKARMLGDTDALREILRKTDAFNRRARTVSGDAAADRLAAIYTAADSLSLKNQRKTTAVLALTAILATMVTMAFLLYDEATLYWMILVCGAGIAALILAVRLSERSEWHTSYLQYRLLAEILRTQSFAHRAGLRMQVTDLLPWSLWTDVPWAAGAAAVLSAGEEDRKAAPDSPQEVSAFIRGQKAYHQKALIRTGRREQTNQRILRTALVLTLVSYAAALVFEIAAGGLLTGAAHLPDPELELWRTVLKIVLGSLSAATLFAGNYYGKLALDEEMEEHRRMAALFESAEACLTEDGADEKLAEGLVREMFGENVRWYVSRSGRRPELGL